MESKNNNNKVELIKTESRMVVAGNCGPEVMGRRWSKGTSFQL